MTYLHVAFGTIALVVVPGALLARKGGTWHRRWGVAFTVSMFVVLFSAGFLWQAAGHLFLVPLAAVSAYLIFNGWRVIARRRRRTPDPIEDRIDMLAACAVIAAGLSTAYLGVSGSTPLLVSIRPALFGIGFIAAAFGVNDLVGFRSPRLPFGWKLAHVSAMLAAYISALTAFLVINAHSVPMMLRWLTPSMLGGIAIALYAWDIIRPALRTFFRNRREPEGAGVAAATSSVRPPGI